MKITTGLIAIFLGIIALILTINKISNKKKFTKSNIFTLIISIIAIVISIISVLDI